MSRELKIMIVIAVIVVLGGLGLMYLSRNSSTGTGPRPADPNVLVKADSNMTGKAGAKVTLVEFGDFQCPACAASAPIVEQILSAYKGNAGFNFVFRNFPLAQHQNALPSAEAAEAAGAQGKYWEMYGKLYTGQNDWSAAGQPVPFFVGYARDLGLDVNRFQQEINANQYQNKIRNDEQDGESLAISATPTFFLNGEAMVGVPNFSDLRTKIDAALAK